MFALIYPALLVGLLSQGMAAAWGMVVFNVVLVPLLDHALRCCAPHWRASPVLLRWCFAAGWFWVYALAQLAVLVWVLSLAARHAPGPLVLWGLASGVGIMTGSGGIAAAHALIHRRSAVERGLGVALLLMVCYPHFRIQHVEGHHRWVATARDPSSARRGERFPTWFVRALGRGWWQAWRIEAARLQRCGRPVCDPRNRMLRYTLLQVLVLGGVLWASGGAGLLLFVLQSLVAVHLLEAVNFVQHYGLRRGNAGMSEAHSWEADDPVSPLLIFNLSRHAHHHRRPVAALHSLPLSTRAPRLPYSFFLMVFLALIPPLWARVMDARLRTPAASGTPASPSMAAASARRASCGDRPGGDALQ